MSNYREHGIAVMCKPFPFSSLIFLMVIISHSPFKGIAISICSHNMPVVSEIAIRQMAGNLGKISVDLVKKVCVSIIL